MCDIYFSVMFLTNYISLRMRMMTLGMRRPIHQHSAAQRRTADAMGTPVMWASVRSMCVVF